MTKFIFHLLEKQLKHIVVYILFHAETYLFHVSLMVKINEIQLIAGFLEFTVHTTFFLLISFTMKTD